MRDLDTNSDNLLPDGAEPARTWADYRGILTASGAGQVELEQFDRVTRRGFLTPLGKGALALGVFGAGPLPTAPIPAVIIPDLRGRLEGGHERPSPP